VAGLNASLFAALRARELRARVGAFVAALAVVVVAALPAARASRTPADATWVRVGVVQPNVQQEIRWVPGEESIESDLFRQTRELVDSSTPKPALVLWPESALPHGWQRVRPQVEALCREKNVAILLNTVWVDAASEPAEPGGAEPPYYNAALLVTKDGPVLPPYKKVRLVPFGEYVPLGPLLRKIRPISRAVPGSFTPGESPMAIPFGAVKLGGAVCYEVVYPWIQREAVRRGANLLFTLTNDAWYGTLGARHQHWQAAVFRAVETGRPLVRAAITGISGAIDPRGVVKARIDEDRKGSFVVDLALGGPPAPAVAVGEAPLAICAAFLFAVILRRRVLTPREPAAA
ncbi:MAG TPA: apolipoprotein N-acyltransferase, partial [Thermoanaerobaculia bacterium]|nr:apolipoprotein N-acyltransferase [Thermoanaerobaculia bacterium]